MNDTNIFKDYPDIIGVNEISQMLGISTKRVYQLLQNGDIKSVSALGKYRVAKVHLIEFILSDSNVQPSNK